jgi:hypothetical protein
MVATPPDPVQAAASNNAAISRARIRQPLTTLPPRGAVDTRSSRWIQPSTEGWIHIACNFRGHLGSGGLS